jgi:hypothetical protein
MGKVGFVAGGGVSPAQVGKCSRRTGGPGSSARLLVFRWPVHGQRMGPKANIALDRGHSRSFCHVLRAGREASRARAAWLDCNPGHTV